MSRPSCRGNDRTLPSQIFKMPDAPSAPRVLVAHLGARRHYAVPRSLASIGCLERVVTDACAQVAPWKMVAALPGSWRRGFLGKIQDRQINDVDHSQIQGCLGFTLSKQMGRLRRRSGETLADFWARQNEAFGTAVAALEWGAADTVYAFNGCALEVFREARRRGLRCVLDQTAAPWRYNTALLHREVEQWPGWEKEPADMDASGRMIEREEAEWALADRIVCGSRFVVEAMKAVGGPVHKSTVVTYPTPAPPFTAVRRNHGGKTRVLFVGTLQLRKGIQYFLRIASQVGGDRFAFRAVGPSQLTPSAEKTVREHVDWHGAVSRGDVWDQYRWADVFLLPTLSEGSANVCLEALCVGVPVITSIASGLPGGDGRSMLVNASDTDAAVATLEALAASRRRTPNDNVTRERSIEDYGRALVAAVGTHLPVGQLLEH